jgi:hypothetical protein
MGWKLNALIAEEIELEIPVFVHMELMMMELLRNAYHVILNVRAVV